MLKIDRKNNFEFFLSEKEKNYLFSNTFFLSFLIALFLHLLFFLLFKIHIPKIDETSEIVTYISIPVDSLISKEINATCEIDLIAQEKENIVAPTYSRIGLPSLEVIDNVEIFNFLGDDKKIDFISPLLEIEKETLKKEFDLSFLLEFKEFEIKASGALSDQLISGQISKSILSYYHQITRKKFIFNVIIDNALGKIIWFEDKNPSQNNQYWKKNIFLLKDLSFNKNQNHDPFTKGKIEIIWNEVLKENLE